MNNIAAIAKLNDDFRANPSLGTFVLTPGIRANSFDDIEIILNKVGILRISVKKTIPTVKRISEHLVLRVKRFFGRLIIMTAILNLLRRMPQTLVRQTVS